MDTCAICGRKRSPEAKLSRIRDGWACFGCVRRSATYLEVPDFGERTRRLASMTAAQLEADIARAAEVDAAREAEAEAGRRRAEEAEALVARIHAMPVTTADLDVPYEVVWPVYCWMSADQVDGYATAYPLAFADSAVRAFDDVGWLQRSEAAFQLCAEGLRRRAHDRGADAVVGMRHRVESSRDGMGMFVSYSYGTAVRLLGDKDVNQLTS